MERQHGTALIYTMVAAVTLMGFASLAVDFGRVQAAKTELRTAADAAARYGATGLATNSATASAYAISEAAANKVDNTPLVLQAGDVVVGTWSAGAFSAGGATPNAVKVSAYRTQARGTAIALLLGQILGVRNCNITTTSVATYTAPGPGWGFVGLSYINDTGNFHTDSYDPAAGAYSAGSAQSNGNIATNGGGNLNGTITVKGNLGHKSSFTINGALNVTGTNSILSSSLSYPAASAGSAVSTNNNMSIPGAYYNGGNFNMSSGTLNLAGGVYYLLNFSFTGGTINMTGPVTIYVNGNITVSNSATINTQNNLPSNFLLYNVSSSGVNISSTKSVYADIYAPNSPLNYNTGADFYGAIISGSISITGGPGWHYDGSQGTGAATGTIAIVE
ncbi:MAG: pilus assembly protein TadG-related protein [Planctomycetota bacterium]|nr:pilus assembly protein TadG-related protein [Planctomycetota bacterium]